MAGSSGVCACKPFQCASIPECHAGHLYKRVVWVVFPDPSPSFAASADTSRLEPLTVTVCIRNTTGGDVSLHDHGSSCLDGLLILDLRPLVDIVYRWFHRRCQLIGGWLQLSCALVMLPAMGTCL